MTREIPIMKRLLRFGVPAFLCAASLSVGVALAQEGGMAMPAWCAKTKEHEALKKYEGNWEFTGMAAGKATGRLILGGNFLEQSVESKMGEMPFEGRLLLGYDTVDKEWIAIWLDSVSPTFSISRGQEKDGVITFKTNDPNHMDPAGKRQEGTMTLKWNGDASYTLAFTAPGGGEMQLVYTKK
jgi:hypothetical protein